MRFGDTGFTTVVSGLPRSGTSVMMQMIAAGGMATLADQRRKPDVDNPRGYFELEAVKAIAREKQWLDDAVGKAFKMVHALLVHLPLDRDYRIVFMRRDLDEVIASQRTMLARNGNPGAALTDGRLKVVYAGQVQQALRWLSERPPFRVLEMNYCSLMANPTTAAREINSFLGGGLDERAMAAAVDPALYRNRMKST